MTARGYGSRWARRERAANRQRQLVTATQRDARVAWTAVALYDSLMVTAFDKPLPASDDALTDEERRRAEAAREVSEWLFEGRAWPTDEELEAIGREWQD